MSDSSSQHPPPAPPRAGWTRLAGAWAGHRLGTVFRSLRRPSYRAYFLGQGVSLVGTWIQNTARGWLVYELTGSAFMLGLVAFCGQIFSFFMTPLAGVLADRFNRRSMILVTQSLATAQALLLGILALTGLIEVWHIIALSLFAGIVSAFDIPARQSFVADMISDKEDFGNAIALNSSLFNIARIIGPMIGALLIAAGNRLAQAAGVSQSVPHAGAGICFVINAASFGAIIWVLAKMDIPPRPIRPLPVRQVLSNMREGFSYAFSHPGIGSILLLLAGVSMLAMPFQELLPIFAKDILGGGAQIYGYLLSATGAGAFAGAILLAARRRMEGLGKLMAVAVGIVGLAMMMFSQSRLLWLSLLLVLVAGFGMMVRGAGANTLIQMLVDDDKRGRVVSIYIMAQMGVAPFGNLIQGYLARLFGAPAVVLVAGLLCLAAAVWFARRLPAIQRHLQFQRVCPALTALEAEMATVRASAENPADRL
jgi:MFS family permease